MSSSTIKIRMGLEEETIEGYYLEKLLNQGNYAHSYKAKRGKENYFFKLYQGIQEDVEKFYNHEKTIKEFLESDENIKQSVVPYVDLFKYKGRVVTVFQWLEGLDLESFLGSAEANFNSPEGRKKRWFIATVFMASLEQLHKNNLIHTDLKPQQIFLISNPRIALKYDVKIADFDFSRIIGKIEPISLVCTEGYESPEHCKNNLSEITAESDIFTATLILWRLLVNRWPLWDDPNNPDMILSNRERLEKGFFVKDIRSIDKRISKELADLMNRALSLNKSERPAASRLKEQLQKEINRTDVKPYELDSPEKDIEGIKPKVVKIEKPVAEVISDKGKIIKFSWKGKSLQLWKTSDITSESIRVISVDLSKLSSPVLAKLQKKEDMTWHIFIPKPEAGKAEVKYNGETRYGQWIQVKNGDTLSIDRATLQIELIS